MVRFLASKESPSMSSLWFKPVCDDLLVKIAKWHINYDQGEVFSTRAFLDKLGAMSAKPIKRASKVAFRPLELEQLATILTAMAPKNPLTADLVSLNEGMKQRFRNIPLANRPHMLTTGEWVIKLAYYKDDVQEIFDILAEAKTGKVHTTQGLMEQQKKAGKDL